MIPRWWPRLGLAGQGVLGLNARNAEYIMRYNPRRLYPLVDDKLATKRLAMEAGVRVPQLYGVIESYHDIRRLPSIVSGHADFVIKPARGSGGDGILVIAGGSRYKADTWRLVDGNLMNLSDLSHHLSNVISGQYSLGGSWDQALVEYCVKFDTSFVEHAYGGVPDIRVLVFLGYPVMAMVRLPTRRSHGKANLHQGAVGAGIDLGSGRTTFAVLGNRPVDEHPDTGVPLAGFPIPYWDELLDLACRCHELTGLGYLGVDIVLDREQGPMLLELNARPGLNIQIANRCGLAGRLRAVERLERAADPAARIAWAREHCAGPLPEAALT
ncbi:MAG: alpha-L-glutamate ligase-like protein [Chromatiales bacterium]|nr:alpha-L-glutamate ligase-like protein [Chromatiales bacterium]